MIYGNVDGFYDGWWNEVVECMDEKEDWCGEVLIVLLWVNLEVDNEL